MTSILFYIDANYQKELYQDLQRFLELPTHDKLGFVMVVVLILAVICLFKMGRKLVIGAYGITHYYIILISIRAGLFYYYYKGPLGLFFLAVVGLVIVAMIGTLALSKKNPILMEWGD